MPKRIDPNIDVDILTDIGLGIPSHVLAKKYKVSPSYISKIKQGHKVPLVRVVAVEMIPLSDLLCHIDSTAISLSHTDYVDYLHNQIKKHTIELHIYTTLLKYLTNNK
jgi:hypothetical protein